MSSRNNLQINYDCLLEYNYNYVTSNQTCQKFRYAFHVSPLFLHYASIRTKLLRKFHCMNVILGYLQCMY